MRLMGWVTLSLVAACLALGACDSGDKIDTSKLEKSFSSGQPAAKSAVDEVKAAVSAKEYAKAGAALQRLATSASLTPDQRQAVDDVATQVRKMVSEKAKEAAMAGEKALGDVQKSLSK